MVFTAADFPWRYSYQEKMEEKTFSSCMKMNKPIRFYGMSAYQGFGFFIFGLLSIVFMIFSGVKFYLMLLIFAGEVYGLFLLSKKLKEAAKDGTPDLLSSWQVKNSTPKKIVDSNRVFKYLINNREDYGN